MNNLNNLNNNGLKRNVISSLFWRFMERSGVAGIQFAVSIILARLLIPKDFGTIGLITVFIAIANVFIESGFSSALIQKKEIDEHDLSSVFYISLSVSIFIYVILFFTSPLIAEFYEEPILNPILRILALLLILGAVNSIQNVVISRQMKFKKSFFVSLGAISVSGITGIITAYLGYGLWSLVFLQLSGQLVTTIILWFTVCWRPRLLFSFKKVKELFHFGSKLLCSALMDTIFNNLYPLMLGKLFDQALLGHFNRGQSIPSMVMNNFDGTISSVMYPVLSSCQNEPKRIKELMRRMIVTSTFLVFPMMIGLLVVARSLVLLLFTDKWLPCVPFLQFACITYLFWPIHTANLQAIKAIGRSDIFLKLEVLKKILSLIIIVSSFKFGIYGVLVGGFFLSLISTVINSWPNRKLLDYTLNEQFLDIMPSLILSATMGGMVVSLSLLPLSLGIVFILQIGTGAFYYFFIAYILKFECLGYLTKTTLKKFNKLSI